MNNKDAMTVKTLTEWLEAALQGNRVYDVYEAAANKFYVGFEHPIDPDDMRRLNALNLKVEDRNRIRQWKHPRYYIEFVPSADDED